jgi:hypothetical protein
MQSCHAQTRQESPSCHPAHTGTGIQHTLACQQWKIITSFPHTVDPHQPSLGISHVVVTPLKLGL